MHIGEILIDYLFISHHLLIKIILILVHIFLILQQDIHTLYTQILELKYFKMNNIFLQLKPLIKFIITVYLKCLI